MAQHSRSAFFEIPSDLTAEEKNEMKRREELAKARPKKTGGLSFDVTINENKNQSDSSTLQSAAAILREKSEKRRSRLAARRQNSNNTTSSSDMPLTTDDLVTDEDRASQPSEAGTYTLRLDSADVRDRRALYDSMIEGKLDENPIPHNDSQELDGIDIESDENDEDKENEKSSEEQRDQNSATESAEDYAVPTDVSHRVSEWFDRNAAAESRQSEAKDENLEDIRQKAKERLEKCKEGKITITRDSRQKSENPRTKGSNPHIRMTRAMLLQRNRALGLDKDKDADKKKMAPPKTVPKPKIENRRVSARLESLSKPRARMMSEDKTRGRSFSHDVDTDKKVAPHPRGRNPKITKQGSTTGTNRSTSLTRAGTGTSLKISKPRMSLDPKMSRPPTMSQSMREGRSVASKTSIARSTSLTRSNTSNLRTPRGTVSQRATIKSPPTPSNSSKRPSTAASSRPPTSLSSTSRPQTAGSNIDKSHETSILYSMRLLSRACIDKTREIYKNTGCTEAIPPLSPPTAVGEGRPELEVLLSNLCHLDQVLGIIQEQSSKNHPNEPISEERVDTFTVDSLAVTSDEPTTVLNLQHL